MAGTVTRGTGAPAGTVTAAASPAARPGGARRARRPVRAAAAPLRAAAGAVLGPLRRRRTWAAAGHAVLALPLGVVALGALVPVLLPPAALVVWLIDRTVTEETVVPFLLASFVLLVPGMALARLLTMLERRLAGRLLGVRAVGPRGRRWRRVAVEEAGWRELLWLLLRVVVAVLVISYWVLVLGLLAESSAPGGGAAGSPQGAVVVVLLSALLALHAGRGLAWLQARAVMPLLGDVAAVRLAEEQERSRRLEDRARLARELHDSVGHGVTLMVLQAGAARATPGDDGREALAAVERSGRAVMADLHRVLGLLDPAVPEAVDPDRARPWSGVEQALRATSEAGVDVHRVVRDLPDDVPPAVEELVARCLREALTNAATHAPGSRVVVDLRQGPPGSLVDGARTLVLSVHDDGARPGTLAPVLPSHRGSGLAGLTTDASALRGTLRAGPRDGGFAVVLTLPAGPVP